ncbi:aldo/keto reductase [Alkalibacterium olivapovliticus]|uniref:Diketogulonate reductase-like aldo/keto reductase n=1 Tax=Alkalibacterium olivapovliticus TaxID=99907 RepID=A0A2T0W737_9LACT|nr:aldo/keto reductase [Alkalibacterium olivapovliticus]PRY82499.1 diketogulonate reductase-like aldo/keto reductase [Alkalibacterium olivapovliticus]
MTNEIKRFSLNDGTTLPAVGLGTVQIKGAKGVTSVLTAIQNGYRLIDTSTNYNNEGMVGEAVRRSTVPREELIISSKLPGAAHDYDKAILMIQESLYRIGIDYFDKYLIHWPLPKQGKYVEAWRALVDAQKFGLIKTIGVSNFLEEHLTNIIDETGVTPATNQIERHPYFNNKELVRVNEEKGILTEAWSPFGREINDVLTNPVIKEIAERQAKTAAQVILRWNIENNVLPIAKSASSKNQITNLDLFDFELTDEDRQQIDSLDQGEDGRLQGQHPNEYEEFD